MPKEIDVRPAFTLLLRECCEGRLEGQESTWFVEGNWEWLTTSALSASL